MKLTVRQREDVTLSFGKPEDRGAVMETFYPWTLTVGEWKKQGLPDEFANVFDFVNDGTSGEVKPEDVYLNCSMADGVSKFESYFGFDRVMRVFLNPPFDNFQIKTLKETNDYKIIRCKDGWIRKYIKNSDIVHEIKPVVENEDDWELLKNRAIEHLKIYYTDENINKKYGKYSTGHINGEYSVRLAIPGFFWTPRDLFGIEQHMMSFYDKPELLHEINKFLLDFYLDKLDKILDVLPADVVYIMEDLSGKNGPMLSPNHFDKFVGSYYKKLVPFLKSKGVKHIFVDTDGDFNVLIPNMLDSGIEGFLPMDVNAGMDIVKVREKFPSIKLIGGFNKLVIEKGEKAIDEEIKRILPVIRQGGYIPGSDHQVPPTASIKSYIYYIKMLKIAMEQCGADL